MSGQQQTNGSKRFGRWDALGWVLAAYSLILPIMIGLALAVSAAVLLFWMWFR